MKQVRKDYRGIDRKLGDQVVDFLLDSQKEGIIDNRYSRKSPSYIYKFDIDDRFISLYSMESGNIFVSNKIEYMGIFDKEDKIIYNASYHLENYLKAQDRVMVSKDTITSIRQTLESNINDSIRKRGVNERQMLFKRYSEKINSIEEYKVQNCVDYAANEFISGSIDYRDMTGNEIIESFCNDTNYLVPIANYNNEVIAESDVLESFYHHDNVVHQLSDQFYQNDKVQEYLAESMFLNQKKFDELMNIMNNQNKYQSLYDRREMVNAIKNHTGVNITIVINYGGDTCEFKFDRRKLLSRLLNSKIKDAWDLGKNYEPVKQFLHEHKESGIGRSDFDLENIQEIRYGRNTLYTNHSMCQHEKKRSRKKDELIR